ncbi:MAG: hypothetical protein RBU30_12130 [Polyangia bacterium]|jgi:hypothetical protein|nr:hypothetical protein [Polyangia bacterium]
MKIVGDETGIAVLKDIRQERPEYLKFLITEATTSTFQFVEFSSSDGRRYLLQWRSRTGELIVKPLG